MTYLKFVPVLVATAVCLATPATAHAQRRGGSAGGGHVVVGHAVPRVSVGRPVVVAPRIVSGRVIGVVPYRPYYYRYRPGIRIGFYAGFGYPSYYSYAYPYPYPYYHHYYPSYAYPGYAYPSYAYPSYAYPGYAYPGYAYPGYTYPGYAYPPTGYASAQPGYTYGGVRIEGAPRDAQVFVDGYYAGIVDDFEGAFKHLNLTAGPHQVEIRIAGQQPVAFDVNVPPNQTITVRVP